MRTPRRNSRWWEDDDLVTMVDAIALTGLSENGVESLVAEGRVADIVIGGIRYFRREDLVVAGIRRSRTDEAR